MKFRGHALLWYHSNPGVAGRSGLSSRNEKLFTDYIAQASPGHYRGRMHSWDVVNEIMQPSDGRADGLRNDFWMKAFGPGYIDIGFHAARAADPQRACSSIMIGAAKRGAENDRFRAATLNFLESAIARRVPIDALGMQGHLSAFGPQVDQTKLRKFLDDVKALGLRILVTEHDVDDSGGPSDIAARDARRRRCQPAVSGCGGRQLRHHRSVLTWGLIRSLHRSGGRGCRACGISPRKLPLDRAMNRKPMWQCDGESIFLSRARKTARAPSPRIRCAAMRGAANSAPTMKRINGPKLLAAAGPVT